MIEKKRKFAKLCVFPDQRNDIKAHLMESIGLDLNQITVNKLLEEFGKGSHKPGSGSAAAHKAKLSAQLIKTVVKLTEERNRNGKYDEHLPYLRRISDDISQRIYPSLEGLFHEDSSRFAKVIQLRNARKEEADFRRRLELGQKLEQATRTATNVLITILTNLIDLVDAAMFCFDNGFQSARGDSGLAMTSALGSASGTLSIIDLNFLSLGVDDWSEEMLHVVNELRTKTCQRSIEVSARLDSLREEVQQHRKCEKELKRFRDRVGVGGEYSIDDIIAVTRDLQNTLWTYKEKLWKAAELLSPLEVLKPDEVIAKVLGFELQRWPSLGHHYANGEQLETAGYVDQQQKLVAISEAFPVEIQRFTLAHELGHLILHNQPVLHRDIPMYHSSELKLRRSALEKQADIFATLFLMPEKWIREFFEQMFLTQQFLISEETAFHLGQQGPSVFKTKVGNLSGLTRFLAQQEFYRGKAFNPLYKIFGVSIGTMAIRLEELKLVKFIP